LNPSIAPDTRVRGRAWNRRPRCWSRRRSRQIQTRRSSGISLFDRHGFAEISGLTTAGPAERSAGMSLGSPSRP